MSVPERDVRFTPAARRDLRSIAAHTQRVWGTEQQADYRAAIERAFRTLRAYPHVGRPRDDLFLGCRSMRAEQHVIYYHQPDDTAIVVRRILHHRQDAHAAVQEPLP